jgi:hypothetical protein
MRVPSLCSADRFAGGGTVVQSMAPVQIVG